MRSEISYQPPLSQDTGAVLNISCYRFVPLDDLPTLQKKLRDKALSMGILGTILIAEEGINLFLAHQAPVLRDFMAWLSQDMRFAELSPKESWSITPPFGKLKVRIKKEIIRMNHPAIRPANGRAPSLPAKTLHRWLHQGADDTGRPVVLLDTRNAFEVDHGTFQKAVDWRLHSFGEFPEALRKHHLALQDKTVVSFCTGGIRCEKAAILMKTMGIKHVYQLEGGLLKYFEEVGGAHFDGACFVFDERVALAPNLLPRNTTRD
jgi:UPF0176 protein